MSTCDLFHSGRVGWCRGALASVAIVVSLVGSGCVLSRHGPTLAEFEPANLPGGVISMLETPWGHVHGELLEVTETGLLILEEDGVSELRWEQIADASFVDVRVRWDPWQPPSPDDRERLRLVSRYVPGLTQEHRERLLRFYGQEAPHRHPRRGAVRPEREIAAFIEATEAELVRYRDSDQATLAGYRQLGPDFPGMGEHWLNPYFVMRSGLDPRRPAVITYLQTPQGRILTGAAFIRVLAPGEASPDFPLPGAWHDHSGTVDEETLALTPAAARHAGHDNFRVSMLHVWTGLDNPGGPFAQDNWAVPFVRLGLPVPRAAGPDAGKALFLASGGDAYYATLVQALAELDPAGEIRLGQALARHRGEVESLLVALGPGPPSSAVEALVPELEATWMRLWDDIRRAVGPEAWSEVAVLAR